MSLHMVKDLKKHIYVIKKEVPLWQPRGEWKQSQENVDCTQQIWL